MFSGYTYSVTQQLREQLRKSKEQLRAYKQELETYELALKIIVCESDGKHYVKGRHGEFGLAQFKKETFELFKKKMNRPELRWTNKWDQLIVLLWALKNGKASHWRCVDKIPEINLTETVNAR